jgi:2-keto-4-pentenoate hydratase/2-oxohepta-3-ene-1,7-dioic acid hydratase in catechol pathway
VTADEVGDVQNLAMWLDVNGQRAERQHQHDDLLGGRDRSYCSQIMTLEPGDIITTGTPPGVGLGQKPAPWYLAG